MRILKAEELIPVISRLCIQANCYLPGDVRERLAACRAAEPWPPARDMLDKIIANYQLAEANELPLCQDTGMACVFLDIGQEVFIQGDLAQAVDEGVRQGYWAGYLRKSVVADPLRRQNTNDNTPAMLYTRLVPGERVCVTVAPKGFGSENMSQIKMLRPADGEQGVIDFVCAVAAAAGPNPCPPMALGVGLGGTFDKAALLAKRALLRELGSPHPDPYYARLEAIILEKINGLGIGPQGFGGATTALAVAIETMPTHIAGLPCAVNVNCHAARHQTEAL